MMIKIGKMCQKRGIDDDQISRFFEKFDRMFKNSIDLKTNSIEMFINSIELFAGPQAKKLIRAKHLLRQRVFYLAFKLHGSLRAVDRIEREKDDLRICCDMLRFLILICRIGEGPGVDL